MEKKVKYGIILFSVSVQISKEQNPKPYLQIARL